MATQTDGKASVCTFQWKIKNISHSWMKMGEGVNSPSFMVGGVAGSKWSLRLYPMGCMVAGTVCLHLQSERIYRRWDEGVNFQLGFLNKDGVLLHKTTTSMNTGRFGCPVIERREKVFITEKEAFLPEDTLTVKCSIWKKGDKPFLTKHLSAQTVFKVNRRSFLWKIDKFSTRESGVRNKFKDALINFDIVVNQTIDFVKKLDINIVSFNDSIKYFSFKASVIDSEEKEDTYMIEYLASDLKVGSLSTLPIAKKWMDNKSRYLPNDDLMLDCEFVSSNGTFLHEVYGYGTFSPKLEKSAVEKRNEPCAGKEEYLIAPVLAKDLKSMFNDGIFSDTELRTSTQTFPAHKNILSARSHVFRRMFINDMKEKNSGNVDITDLEDDTVQRMLIYIYTDALDDLQYKTAYSLYTAADKYEIMSLRDRCSSFLKANLCPTKACEVLVLADRHQDKDLKSSVEDYILRHSEEVFGSLEWTQLMTTNLQVAADIMYRKVFPGSHR